MSKLVIAGREFNSRLFLGTGKFNNNELMARAIHVWYAVLVACNGGSKVYFYHTYSHIWSA